MDAGGQVSVITRQCAKRLGVKLINCYLPLKGIGGPAGTLKQKVRVFVRSWFDGDFVFPVELYVIEKWHSIHPQSIIVPEKPPFDHLLADGSYHLPAPVELLLGAEVWAAAIGSTVYRNRKGAMMQSSMLGCLALGRFELREDEPMNYTSVNITSGEFDEVENMLLDEALKRFWTWEKAMDREKSAWNADEQAVEKHFLESHYRNKEGRQIRRYVKPIFSLCVKNKQQDTCKSQADHQAEWRTIYRITRSNTNTE